MVETTIKIRRKVSAAALFTYLYGPLVIMVSTVALQASGRVSITLGSTSCTTNNSRNELGRLEQCQGVDRKR